MSQIILDWGALSQIIQQGGALEQALRTSGASFAVTNYTIDEIPDNFQSDYRAIRERLNIQVVEIEADLRANTRENRQLGVAFDSNGNAVGQLADASYRWLEQNGSGFSNGTYSLLTNDRGLISYFDDIAPTSVIATNLDLIGRAVLRGDISIEDYNSYIDFFRLQNGDIRGISPRYNDLVLDRDMLSSIQAANSGGLSISDSEFVRIVTDSRLLTAAGVAGDVFGLAITVSEINMHIRNENYAAAEQLIFKFTAGFGGGAVGAIGTVAVAGLLAPEFFSTATGAIVLLGLAALGGYVGGEAAEDFAGTLVAELQDRLANGESLVIDDIIAIRDDVLQSHGLNSDDFRLVSVNGQLSFVQECFCAGTSISMWPRELAGEVGADGHYREAEILSNIWNKPIEDVKPNDLVISFDKNGNLRPGRITRLFRNDTKIILDFFGTFATPGHVYLRVDNDGRHSFASLIDILREDGVIEAENGTRVRAATGVSIDEPRDRFVWAVTGTATPAGSGICVREKGQLRLGTRFITQDGRDFCIADLIEIAGGVVTDEGLVRLGDAEMPFHWTFGEQLPKPEDYILQRSGTTLVEIYRAAEWEGRRPSSPAPMVMDGAPVQPFSQSELADMPRNMPLALRGGAYAAAKRPMLAGRSTRNLSMDPRKSIEADHGKWH